MGQRFEVRRLVQIESDAGKVPPIAVVEFLGHGKLTDQAANVAVFDLKGPIPWRILQAGPGDFCRVAFQTASKAGQYQVYYGGVEPETSPVWSEPMPLLLETRQWRECNLNSLASIQSAFDQTPSEGSNFVDNVFHRWNPITSAPRPFLSHYAGTIHVPKGGNYAFFTSSEDASFLLVDGQEVVSAPGRHFPSGQANFKGQVMLKAGVVRFDYWHAASGDSACMVAAWQPPGDSHPVVIPASAFSPTPPVLFPATMLQRPSGTQLPDFTFRSIGEVALVDSDVPLVRVQFMDVPLPRRQTGGKIHWDFGDGQSSDQHEPIHVFLRPGRYEVKLSAGKGQDDSAVVSVIHIERPLILPQRDQAPDELATYLPILEQYDPIGCDGPALLQLVCAFEQKERWTAAVAAGTLALKQDALKYDDELRYQMAQRVGRILRERLLSSKDAADAWASAALVITQPEWRARCKIEAADILINELAQVAEAKQLIESAALQLNSGTDPELTSRFHRVRGDVLARQSDGKEARAAYALAARALKDRRNEIANNAWRGARSRSVEAHLRDRALDAARSELDLWLAEFPADKIEGYLPLLQSRYWMARKAWEPATAVARDLLTVNAASPYADQLVVVVAQCEQKMGHPERAAAAYRSLLADYPGSPLVEHAQKELARLETDDAAPPNSKSPQRPE
jgi:TolA-binding protein